MTRSFIAALLIATLYPAAVWARGSSTTFLWSPTDHVEDERAIRAAVDEATAAWNAGDAAGYAARFAADATFTGVTGVTAVGQRAFESWNQSLLSAGFRGSHLKQTVRHVRFVSKDVAVVDIDTELTGFTTAPPGVKTWPDGVLRTRLQEVFVKSVNGWWIDGYHEVDAKVPESRS
jgi:uncharacterized protein (TIGR02246 family)